MKQRSDVRRALLWSVFMRSFWKARGQDLEAKGAIYEHIERWRHERRQRSPWYERG
jgi:hypothetical protein